MKKGFLFTMFAALALCFTVACTDENEGGDNNGGNNGGGNDYATLIVGTWQVDNMTVDGNDMTPQNVRFTFNTGGTGLLNDNGVTENNEFSWSISDNQITIQPRHGTMTYTIVSLTQTSCTFTGTVVPGTDIEGDVSVHMTKVNGGDNPDPGPGPNPANFPEGTMWEYQFDSTFVIEGIAATMNMTIGIDFIDASNCDLSFHAVASAMGMTLADENETTPFTYTYNSTASEGVLYAVGTDPDTGEPFEESLTFVYNSSDNTIVIDVPADYFQSDEGDEGDEDAFDMPTHWVFQRVR